MITVALLRAFRRSPIDFLELLVASGASIKPLRVGPERVLLLDDPAQGGWPQRWLRDGAVLWRSKDPRLSGAGVAIVLQGLFLLLHDAYRAYGSRPE
jgi:hypothetical protein